MKLVIDISALDRTNAAVASITNTTPVSALQTLVLGDSEPLDLTFTDSAQTPAAAPSWAGQAGYTVGASLGLMDANAGLNLATGSSFSTQTNGWTGRLNTNTAGMISAMQMAVANSGGWSNISTDPRARNSRPFVAWFWLQIEVFDPSNNRVSYCILRVPVLNRVL